MKRLLMVLNGMMITIVSGAMLTSCVDNKPALQNTYVENPISAGGYGSLPITDIEGNFWTGYRTQKEKYAYDASNDVALQKSTGVPLSSYWMPTGHDGKIINNKISLGADALLNWDKNKDKDAKYNVASVPLQKREIPFQLANKLTDPTGKVLHVGLMNVNDHTSGFASQGSFNEFDGFNFVNWQYLDYMISWAGSTGEGIVVPPSADITDAAHKNGVKSIGVIFLAPTEFGMTPDRAAGMFVKDSNGNFLVVDKLLEIAKYYHFDGWFINNESPNQTYNEDDLHDLMRQFEEKKEGSLDNEIKQMTLLSYANAGLSEIKGQEMFELNGHKISDIYMQDFNTGYSEDIVDPLQKINNSITDPNPKRSSYSILSSIKSEDYDSQLNNIGEINYSKYVKIKDNNKYFSSLATFGFADSWTNWGRKIAGAVNNDPDHKKLDTQVLINNLSDDLQNKLYTGTQMEPTVQSEGIGAFISERTPVVGNSFTTNFGKGQGTFYASDGNTIADKLTWNNRDLESIAPTYMWHITNAGGNSLQPRYDYSQAFEGGNSLKIGSWKSYNNYEYNESWQDYNVEINNNSSEIKKAASSTVDLYASDINVTTQTYNLIFKALDDSGKKNLINAADVQLVFTIKDAKGNISTVQTKAQSDVLKNSDDWSEITGNLKDLAIPANSKIIKIGVCVTGKENIKNYNLYLGKLTINDNTHNELDFAKNLNVEWLTPKNDLVNARMTWTKSAGNVDHYDIYQIVDNKYIYLGSTRNNAYFAQNIKLQQSKNIVLAVKAINEYNYKTNKITIRQFNF